MDAVVFGLKNNLIINDLVCLILEKILKENGFKIINIDKNGNYFEYLAQEIRRIFSIGKEYSNSNIFLKIIFLLPAISILIFLHILSNRDKGSKDILCYGLHIIAQKQ